MIYTVFPKNEDEMPQDFETYQEAFEYAEELKKDFGIDSEISQVI